MSRAVMSKRWKAVAWLVVATGLTVCSAVAPEPWFQVSAYAAVLALVTAVLLLLSARSGPAARAGARVRMREDEAGGYPPIEQACLATGFTAGQQMHFARVMAEIQEGAARVARDLPPRRNLGAMTADALPELTEETVCAAFSDSIAPILATSEGPGGVTGSGEGRAADELPSSPLAAVEAGPGWSVQTSVEESGMVARLSVHRSTCEIDRGSLVGLVINAAPGVVYGDKKPIGRGPGSVCDGMRSALLGDALVLAKLAESSAAGAGLDDLAEVVDPVQKDAVVIDWMRMDFQRDLLRASGHMHLPSGGSVRGVAVIREAWSVSARERWLVEAYLRRLILKACDLVESGPDGRDRSTRNDAGGGNLNETGQ